ncbi:hypothetical protein Ahy_B07g087943 isoform A [Arachis hypogaea]|uniref:Yippee domain-containing protein n=1 Tax=Arachis hypogaea TaxID=3818 RepID=A0A444YDD5_ARAHY|nr:hypothetical protein Ahy_B07g087943 isoform A [Arachis hypogaea]
MGRVFVTHLEGKFYSCKHCRTHLALCQDIVSKNQSLILRLELSWAFVWCWSLMLCLGFGCVVNGLNKLLRSQKPKHNKQNGLSTADMGKLISSVSVNVSLGENEERQMMTGWHTVADIFCVGCGSIVGWKYETAHEKTQKYKEGKSVLERYKVSGPDGSNYWVSHEAHVGGSDVDDA